MSRRLFKLLVFSILLPPPDYILAQNDAFFYQNYEDKINRENTMGFSFDAFDDGTGLKFNNFNNHYGFNFDNFSNGGNGFSFGNYDLSSENEASLGGGLLLLGSLSFIYFLKKKNHNEN